MPPRLLGTGVAAAATAACVAAAVLALVVHSTVSVAHVDPWPGLVAVAQCGTGAVLVHLRPRNPIGWLLVLSGLLQGGSVGLGAYGGYGVDVAEPAWPLATWAALLGSMLWLPSMLIPLTVLVAVYPSGRLPARWWRWPFGAVCAGLAVATGISTFSQSAYDDIASGTAPLQLPDAWWVTVGGLTATAAVVLGAAVLWAGTLVRLVRARRPERQQLAWLVCVVVPLAVAVFFVPWAPATVTFALLVPVAVAVGVVRYRLLGIVVSRGLVYVALTVAVVAGYLAVAALAGNALGRTIAPVPGAVAAALLAVALSPVHTRLQQAADRFVYGERRDPVAAVTRLGDRVAEVDEADLLPAALGTVTAALRTRGAAVLGPDDGLLAVSGDVDDGPPAVRVGLRVGGRDVGTLVVAPRAPAEPLTAADERLIGALAPQVAVVVRALDLARSLERERDRVLAATHAERDRIRRDLHDGLGPSLAGVSLGVQAVQVSLPGPGNPVTDELLPRLRTEVDAAVGEVRRIIDGLRPAALDDLGLLAAIRRQADTLSTSVPVRIDAGELPPLPPDVETAAFRIAQEALTNVARHSGARSAEVGLRISAGRLEVAVADDGIGMPAPAGPDEQRTPGLGLASMRQRAQAVGGDLSVESRDGGTRVVAALPLGAG
ncbi:ATP-binding protein [Geodermatophilus sp. CPCC 206100]|uniref:sensor histidine kinase n=1 Tax=Geodermatophilus sp. CPCC 206100 TaxID=3020054 RepID=UPI003B00A704